MPYIKDDMKRKDSDKLDEMKKEINDTLADEQKQTDNANDAENQVSAEDISADDSQDDTAAVKAQFEAGQKALAESDERFKRLQADFVNFRRRSAQEKSEISDFILQGFLKDMLPVLDNFERALAAEGDDSDAFKSGIKMIANQFKDALTKTGLEAIKTEGEKFDPNFHQAVMRVEDPEKEDNTIEQELQKGYMVHGRVVRPAMVKVVSN